MAQTLEVPEEVSHTTVIVEGDCSRCGDCCKPQVMNAAFMLNDKEDGCKYLTFDGGTMTCTITEGKHDDPPAEKPDGVPQDDYDYYLAECKPYPEPQYHPDKRLPTNCSLNFKEV